MTLVIQLPQSTGGSAPKFYRDPIVDDKTVLHYDFSNGGNLLGAAFEDGGVIYNLARDNGVAGASLDTMEIYDPNGGIALSAGKGLVFSSLDGANTNQRGLRWVLAFKDWLHANYAAIDDLLLVAWLRVTAATISEPTEILLQRGTVAGTNASLVRITAGIGGKGTLGFAMGGEVQYHGGWQQNRLEQWAAHYDVVAGDFKVYRDGVEQVPSTVAGTLGALGPITDNQEGFIGSTNAAEAPVNLYRVTVQDFTGNPKTLSEYLKYDRDYVLGEGDFSHISPRPFVSVA